MFHHEKGLRYYQDLGKRTADFVLLAVPIIAAIWYAIAMRLMKRPAAGLTDSAGCWNPATGWCWLP